MNDLVVAGKRRSVTRSNHPAHSPEARAKAVATRLAKHVYLDQSPDAKKLRRADAKARKANAEANWAKYEAAFDDLAELADGWFRFERGAARRGGAAQQRRDDMEAARADLYRDYTTGHAYNALLAGWRGRPGIKAAYMHGAELDKFDLSFRPSPKNAKVYAAMRQGYEDAQAWEDRL
jgi:hypothetical protein